MSSQDPIRLQPNQTRTLPHLLSYIMYTKSSEFFCVDQLSHIQIHLASFLGNTPTSGRVVISKVVSVEHLPLLNVFVAPRIILKYLSIQLQRLLHPIYIIRTEIPFEICLNQDEAQSMVYHTIHPLQTMLRHDHHPPLYNSLPS